MKTNHTKFVVCENPVMVNARKYFSYKGAKNAMPLYINIGFREQKQDKKGTYIATRP
jgi:hypothetical protein